MSHVNTPTCLSVGSIKGNEGFQLVFILMNWQCQLYREILTRWRSHHARIPHSVFVFMRWYFSNLLRMTQNRSRIFSQDFGKSINNLSCVMIMSVILGFYLPFIKAHSSTFYLVFDVCVHEAYTHFSALITYNSKPITLVILSVKKKLLNDALIWWHFLIEDVGTSPHKNVNTKTFMSFCFTHT